MAAKKQTTKKQKSKGNFVDFMEYVSDRDRNLGGKFVQLLNEDPRPSADRIHEFFKKSHYDGVGLMDCTKMLNIVKKLGHIDQDGLEQSY